MRWWVEAAQTKRMGMTCVEHGVWNAVLLVESGGASQKRTHGRITTAAEVLYFLVFS
jgi:hypothetical protein